jgi:hypothetical protein
MCAWVGFICSSFGRSPWNSNHEFLLFGLAPLWYALFYWSIVRPLISFQVLHHERLGLFWATCPHFLFQNWYRLMLLRLCIATNLFSPGWCEFVQTHKFIQSLIGSYQMIRFSPTNLRSPRVHIVSFCHRPRRYYSWSGARKTHKDTTTFCHGRR